MGLAMSYTSTAQRLKLTGPIPMVELLYRLARFQADDFRGDLNVVRQITSIQPSVLSTGQLAGIRQSGYFFNKGNPVTPGCERFDSWGVLTTIVLELHRDLLPPLRERNRIWEVYRRLGLVDTLREQDLSVELRYLYPFIDHTTRRFDVDHFLRQCTDWQIEHAIGKLIVRCGGRMDSRLDLPLTEQV